MIAEFQEDSILQKWINPRYLDPRPLRDIVDSKPYTKYVVIDNFFNNTALKKLVQRHNELVFQKDDIGLRYDSTAVKIYSENKHNCELFFHQGWYQYCAYITGTCLNKPGKTTLKLRRHPKWAKGFWPHTDVSKDKKESKAMTVLGYFNEGWQKADGGLLQLWRAYSLSDECERVYSWKDYEDKRLSFLIDNNCFAVTAVAPVGLLPLKIELLDQIEPIYNRVVFCDFQRTPAFHSVTPSNNRIRDGFVQWLY